MQTAAAAPIDTSWTVNDVLRYYPMTAPLLDAFSIDTCCGGALRLDEAALAASIAPDTLVMALQLRIGASSERERPVAHVATCCSVRHA